MPFDPAFGKKVGAAGAAGAAGARGEGGSATVRRAAIGDGGVLHELAASTFGLACPPGTTQASIDDFIATHLSTESFERYLADPDRELFIAEVADSPVGYTMLVFGDPTDVDVAAAVSAHPTVELSKVYVRAEHHGSGVSSTLVEETVAHAAKRGVAGVWLGVNQFNPKANRFYEKHGFAKVGTKKFLVGGNWEDDFVRERRL